VIHNYGKFKISVAIPKYRTLPRSLISPAETGSHDTTQLLYPGVNISISCQ